MKRLLRGNRLRRVLLVASLVAVNILHAAEVPIGRVAGEALDLRILIDISGDIRNSMPEGQHLDAVAMLLAQLPAGSKAGVWTFGKYPNLLVTYGRVDDRWRTLAGTQLPAIRAVATWRDIARVVTDATFDEARPAAGYRRELLLISSGGINTSDAMADNDQAQQRMLAEQVGPLREAGFRIHTLALNGEAGRDFLGALAKEGDGLFFGIDRPEQVHAALARFADFLLPRNVAPFADREFAIDDGVDRFRALLIGDPRTLVLESPSGKRLAADRVPDTVTWQAGALHVRVDVDAPEPGLWRVRGDAGADSRIYIEANRVITLEPLRSHYVSGEKFAVVVQTPTPDDSPGAYQPPVEVTLQADGFEGAETFTRQLQPDPNQPGYYALDFPGLIEPDNYQLTIAAHALDYSRVIRSSLQIRELLSLEVQQRILAEGNVYTLKAKAVDKQLDLARSRLLVEVANSAGETSSQVLLPVDDAWQLEIPDDGVSETYRLDLQLVGETISGRSVDYQPRPLMITLPERSVATAIDPAAPAKGLTSDDDPSTAVQAGREAPPAGAVAPVTEPEKGNPREREKGEQDTGNVDGAWSWLLVMVAAGCVVIGGGLSGFYLWSRRRQPGRFDLASDAAAYRTANRISIRRIFGPGQTFPEAPAAEAALAPTQRSERTGPAPLPGDKLHGAEVAARYASGEVPLLEDVVLEDIVSLTATPVAEDILPEESAMERQTVVARAPGRRKPEPALDIEGEAHATPAGSPGERGKIAVPALKSKTGEAEAAIEGSAGGAPAIEVARAAPGAGDEVAAKTIATAAPVISTTRMPELADSPVEAPDTPTTAPRALLETDEEAPDFKTVDAALAEEIAADTALAEETELASEWHDEDQDLIARELAGKDPFAEYRAEYEAKGDKEGG